VTNTLELGRRAFDALAKGLRDADWTAMLAMITDDVRTELDLPAPFQGVSLGRQRFIEMTRFISEERKVRLELTALGEPMVATNRTAIEFRSHALHRPRADRTIVAIFEFEGDRIRCFREYFSADEFASAPSR
jgi:ketosteroid isomerase-like protein